MASDLGAAILAKLDEYAQDHQPCDPGVDCLHRAVDAVRAVVERHLPDPLLSGRVHCTCGPVRYPCENLRAIAEALGIREVSGG